MRKTIGIMTATAFLLGLAAYLQGGASLALEGLRRGGGIFLSVLPLLLAAYVVGGMVSILLPWELTRKWLGEKAGWRGIFLGSAAGAITPGGPYVCYPIAANLKKAGAGEGTLLAYITGKSLWDLARIPLEIAILGPVITAYRWLLTFYTPIIISCLYFRLFSKQGEK